MFRSILTVTQAAQSKDLISLDDLKTSLQISGTDDDASLQLLITGASTAIADYCKRTFHEETLSEQFRQQTGHHSVNYYSGWRGVENLILARRPVASITSVTEGTTVLDASTYEVTPDSGILSRLCNDRIAKWYAHKIVVVYVAGYAADAMPPSLQLATTKLVKLLLASATRDPTVKTQWVKDIERLDFWIGAIGENGALPPDVCSLIDPFCPARIRAG
nr:MAG TPA: Head Tail Connector Protein [Caudoviricetes sp.]